MLSGEELSRGAIQHQPIVRLLVDSLNCRSTASYVVKSWDDFVEAATLRGGLLQEFLIALVV
jgi:hypothetical protein